MRQVQSWQLLEKFRFHRLSPSWDKKKNSWPTQHDHPDCFWCRQRDSCVDDLLILKSLECHWSGEGVQASSYFDLVYFCFCSVFWHRFGVFVCWLVFVLLGFFACQYSLKVCILLPQPIEWWVELQACPTLQALIGSVPTAHKSLDYLFHLQTSPWLPTCQESIIST